jgi:hypothetical protein
VAQPGGDELERDRAPEPRGDLGRVVLVAGDATGRDADARAGQQRLGARLIEPGTGTLAAPTRGGCGDAAASAAESASGKETPW